MYFCCYVLFAALFRKDFIPFRVRHNVLRVWLSGTYFGKPTILAGPDINHGRFPKGKDRSLGFFPVVDHQDS
jgi:hypothetical protein